MIMEDEDFWHRLVLMAGSLDGSGQSLRWAIKRFLHDMPLPDGSAEDFRRYAVRHLLEVLSRR